MNNLNRRFENVCDKKKNMSECAEEVQLIIPKQPVALS